MRRILIGHAVSSTSILCVLNLNTRGGFRRRIEIVHVIFVVYAVFVWFGWVANQYTYVRRGNSERHKNRHQQNSSHFSRPITSAALSITIALASDICRSASRLCLRATFTILHSAHRRNRNVRSKKFARVRRTD